MTDELEAQLAQLLALSRDPVAVVVFPGALSDPQAFADRHGVQVREWAGARTTSYFIQNRWEESLGKLVVEPRPTS